MAPEMWLCNAGGLCFSNTIAENIALCDDVPDMYRVRKAAEIANIRKWIETLPLGYNTKIGPEGHGLSAGQKQRILIARASYKNSPYLFFDEATNSLMPTMRRLYWIILTACLRTKPLLL